ncbi:MAG: alpha-amylase family protein [Adhaeribacter sp.]
MHAENTSEEVITDNKLIIYQLLVRLFGNCNSTNKPHGSREENGVGRFADISDLALAELHSLGVSHVWYTGVLEHATMSDHTRFGIPLDDPDVVKGRAGSPYAIKDYYDVDPDLARDVPGRLAEFQDLVNRSHAQGLKVLIDFVPNHVARTYRSDAAPAGVRDFGTDDDTGLAFHPGNDFYYVPGQPFRLPYGTEAGGTHYRHPLKDYHFDEFPAKATGNNVFSASPSLQDWYETVKLNYGVDFNSGQQTYFQPLPPVWTKMRDILAYWAGKGVDGFRCDMAEMVPVEFWNWVIPEVKKAFPNLVFIAEAYNPREFPKLFTTGCFDFLYDKVGLYDGLRPLIKDESHGHVDRITHVWKTESRGFSSRMLRFLENHDEERLASEGFAGNPWYAKPAMVVSATLSSGPVMIYFGQEVGEPGRGAPGFSGEDNRTTIFDYWGVPEHQKWMNQGRFDGRLLSEDQKKLRAFYKTLLNAAGGHPALRAGRFYELSGLPGFSHKHYAYLRFTSRQRVLVVANFDRHQHLHTRVQIPGELASLLALPPGKPLVLHNLLTGETGRIRGYGEGIQVTLAPTDACLISF